MFLRPPRSTRTDTLFPYKPLFRSYLNGIIGMAGDLDQATSFLLHPFMQRVVADLGGAAGLPDGKVQPTISRLEKAGRNRPSFDLKEPTDRAALGNFIVKAAQELKSPLHFLRHAAIR